MPARSSVSVPPVRSPTIPRVLTAGRWWSADELAAMAGSWRAQIIEKVGGGERLIAAALPATAEAVALFAALISLPSPLILLNPDVRAWRSEPAVPPGTPLVLIPSLAHLGPEAEKLGLGPVILGESRGTREFAAPLVMFRSSGVVIFTSGSTGPPRPAFRPLPGLLAVSSARIRALELHPGAGILMGVSLASGQALNFLLISMLLGGPLGLLDPLDHRAALDALARPDFQCSRATPHFADALGRCALTGPAIAPPGLPPVQPDLAPGVRHVPRSIRGAVEADLFLLGDRVGRAGQRPRRCRAA